VFFGPALALPSFSRGGSLTGGGPVGLPSLMAAMSTFITEEKLLI